MEELGGFFCTGHNARDKWHQISLTLSMVVEVMSHLQDLVGSYLYDEVMPSEPLKQKIYFYVQEWLS